MSSPIAVAPSQSPLAWIVAGCCAGAALIHFTVISGHAGGDVIVPVGFAVTGLAQAGVAAALASGRWTRGTLWAAVLVNVAATVAWVWSRTAGLPFDPYGGVAEAAGTLDLTSVALQATAITLAAGMLVSRETLRAPLALAVPVSLGAIAFAAVVVVTPDSPPAADVVVGSPAGGAASGGGGHGNHGGGAAAAPAASGGSGDHAADMIRIDRARCDLAFNPRAYWGEALAMGVDTYFGGAMAMETPPPTGEVARPSTLGGRGSEHLDQMISLTTMSSGEVSAARLITALGEATDEEYDAWRRWVAANPGEHSSTPLVPGQPQVPTMGHPGPTTWKAMVDQNECDQLTAELDQARAVAERYPTVADATAAGWVLVTGYLPGIATHYMNFDLVDGTFSIDEPEMLLYDGTSPDARIVGLSYYVRLDGTAAPTQGFTGDNDQYHRHFGLCVSGSRVVGDSTTTDEECAARGGSKASGTAGWMSHAWVVPGCESPWGVFSGENPILDNALNDASGQEGSEGCNASRARDRYDLSPGESDLLTRGGTDEEVGR